MPPLPDAPNQPAPLLTRLHALRELLASMRFAIALLTVICIASIIGTVLKQHEPVANYINQFGPFWSQVFLALDLNAVYSAWWFLLILAFLVLSTTLCLLRHTPKYLKDLKNFQENIRINSLRSMPRRAEATLAEPPEQAARRIGSALQRQGWRVKLQERPQADGHTGYMLAAKAGAANKLGYIASHAAIVLICLGGLLDGNLIVRAQTWWGGKTPYVSGPVTDEHILPASNPTFRGSVKVDEGKLERLAVLLQSDGMLLQPLPFALELRKFTIDYYDTGMPKLFSSDVVIHDLETGEKLEKTIEVNHPVNYRGVEIYQSGFDDGGSPVTLRAIALDGKTQPFTVQGHIGSSLALGQPMSGSTLEFTELRTINVEDFSNVAQPTRSTPAAASPQASAVTDAITARLGGAHKTMTEKQLRNVGPSIGYKLRDAAGQAREYQNFMAPVDFGDGPVFLLGVRNTPAEDFRYLRVPADERGSIDTFWHLHAALHNATLREQAVQRYVRTAVPKDRDDLRDGLTASARRVVHLFAAAQDAAPDIGPQGRQGEASPTAPRGGLQAISRFLEDSVPPEEQGRAADVVLRILNGVLYELALLAREQARLPALAADAQATAFMTQAVFALSDAQFYPAPAVFMLEDFTHVQASVFQVARAPGKHVVYLGCLLLVVGIFAMLYVRDRRLWVWLAPATQGTPTSNPSGSPTPPGADNSTEAIMALSSNRRILDVEREFARLRTLLLPGSGAQTPPPAP